MQVRWVIAVPTVRPWHLPCGTEPRYTAVPSRHFLTVLALGRGQKLKCQKQIDQASRPSPWLQNSRNGVAKINCPILLNAREQCFYLQQRFPGRNHDPYFVSVAYFCGCRRAWRVHLWSCNFWSSLHITYITVFIWKLELPCCCHDYGFTYSFI